MPSQQVMTKKKSTVRPRHQKNKPKRYLDTSIICNLITFARIAILNYIK